jgi:Family of unknown function (DUF5681)
VTHSNLEKGKPYRFQPGVSGNPGGRPKKRPISDRYMELVELEVPEEYRIKQGLPVGATFGDAIAMATVKTALAGNPATMREIREAIEGKTGQRPESPDVQDRGFEIRVTYEPSTLNEQS